MTAHAVGDRAIEMMLNAIEQAVAKWPRADHRHRIEHCAICPPDLIERIKRLGVVPVAQPVFFWEFGDGYPRNYGPDRVRWMFPVRAYVEKGIIAAGGSDCPVTRVDPLWGIYEAMSRVTMNGRSAGAEGDLTGARPEEVRDASVLLTMVGGEVVHGAFEADAPRRSGWQ